MDLLAVITAGLCTLAVAVVAIFGLGVYVVRRYPNEADPARNAKRFTVTAAIILFVGAVALVAVLASIAVGFFSAIT